MKHDIRCIGCDIDLSTRVDWEPVVQVDTGGKLEDIALDLFFGDIARAPFAETTQLHLCAECIAAIETRKLDESVPCQDCGEYDTCTCRVTDSERAI